MIHKKGGRIRTYGRPAPALLGWVAGLAPLAASVPEMRCATESFWRLASTPGPSLSYRLGSEASGAPLFFDFQFLLFVLLRWSNPNSRQNIKEDRRPV